MILRIEWNARQPKCTTSQPSIIKRRTNKPTNNLIQIQDKVTSMPSLCIEQLGVSNKHCIAFVALDTIDIYSFALNCWIKWVCFLCVCVLISFIWFLPDSERILCWAGDFKFQYSTTNRVEFQLWTHSTKHRTDKSKPHILNLDDLSIDYSCMIRSTTVNIVQKNQAHSIEQYRKLVEFFLRSCVC